MKISTIWLIFNIYREDRSFQFIFDSDENREISHWIFYIALKENREQLMSSKREVRISRFLGSSLKMIFNEERVVV